MSEEGRRLAALSDMTAFHYKAVTPGGQVVEGSMEAADRATVIARLRAQGHLPIRAEAGRRPWRLTRRAVGGRELAVLTRSVATLLTAGLTLERAIETVLRLNAGPAARHCLGVVLDAVRGGAAFSDAIAAQGNVFPPFYVSMVRAGEAGGSLEVVMQRLADHLERAQALKATVASALVYPLLLLAMVGATVTLLVTVVLPQFEPLFADAGDALPLGARLVMAAASLLRLHGWLLPAGLGLALLALRGFRRRPAGRLALDRLVLRLPVFGGLVARIEGARFCRTLATLLGNGVPLLAALVITKDTLSNAAMRKGLAEIAEGLKEGQGMAGPLARKAVLPALATQLAQIGEETGQLEGMLAKAAEIYDQEIQRAIARLLALLVPAITILLGLLIAGIIGSILSAMLSVYKLPL